MDIHNIDEYLDLQGQGQLNLLSTEEFNTEPQEEQESEWHSATAATTTGPHSSSVTTLDDNSNTPSLSEMLEAAAATTAVTGNPYLFNVDHASTNQNSDTNDTTTTAEWGLLQNNLDLQGIHLTQMIGNSGGISVDNNTFITPDSLLKQQPPKHQQIEEEEEKPVVEAEEKRVTRSKASPTTTAAKKEVTTNKSTAKKKISNTRAKKLYCICQQPYNGKPMVQCDRCEEWFHCTCVGFDPDDQDDEDIDWVCKNCLEGTQECKQKEPKQEEKSSTAALKAIPAPAVIISSTSTRQTRGSSRNQSKCLYPSCSNRTRADSYCSDVCARRHKEQQEPQQPQPQRSTRVSRMKGATLSISTDKKSAKSRATAATKKKNSPSSKTNKKEVEEENEDSHVEEDEEDASEAEIEEEEEDEEEGEEAADGTETPDTPMSPSQMTEEENPVRRNVIKNITTILKQIMDTALEDNPELFDDNKKEEQEQETKPTTEERAEKLAKSIENTMLEQLGDTGKSQKSRRTCGEPYKSKFRSLLYNLKDKQNQVFQLRVITGDLSPLELVKMSSEDMANPELKSKAEVFRKMGLKSVVMKLDNTPIIKKTHKGDIIMIPNKDNDTNQSVYSDEVAVNNGYDTPTLTQLNKEEDEESQKEEKEVTPTQVEHRSTTTTAKEEERKSSISSTSHDGTKKADPLDDILARIGIPSSSTSVASLDEKNPNKRTSLSDASSGSECTKKRKVTFNVEELLGDEDDDTPFQVDEVDTSELEQDTNMEQKLPTIWQGKVNMPQVAEFEASARQIGGRTLSETEWSQVLSPTMWIEGRIPAERVTSYVTQNQYSTSREIVLLEIEPDHSDKGETQSQTLLKYLDSRQRYAVVGHNKIKVKDFYLIPLYKVQHIPDCLYVVRVEETKRECDLFLGVLVLTKNHPVVTPSSTSHHHHKAQVVPATPMVSAAATSHSPTTSSSSTMSHHQQAYTQQQQSYAIPQQQQQSYYQNYQEQPQYGYGYQAAANQSQQQPYDQSYDQQQQGYHLPSQPQQQNNNNSRYYDNNGSRNNNNVSYSGSSYRPNY